MTKEELKEIVEKIGKDANKDTFAIAMVGDSNFEDVKMCLKGERIQLAVGIGLILSKLLKATVAEEKSILPIQSSAVMGAFTESLRQSLLEGLEKGVDVEADSDGSYLDPTKPAPKPKTPGEKVSWEETINEILGVKK